jgi:hypothetical protein
MNGVEIVRVRYSGAGNGDIMFRKCPDLNLTFLLPTSSLCFIQDPS